VPSRIRAVYWRANSRGTNDILTGTRALVAFAKSSPGRAAIMRVKPVDWPAAGRTISIWSEGFKVWRERRRTSKAKLEYIAVLGRRQRTPRRRN
jgi:hypothetical protein